MYHDYTHNNIYIGYIVLLTDTSDCVLILIDEGALEQVLKTITLFFLCKLKTVTTTAGDHKQQPTNITNF